MSKGKSSYSVEPEIMNWLKDQAVLMSKVSGDKPNVSKVISYLARSHMTESQHLNYLRQVAKEKQRELSALMDIIHIKEQEINDRELQIKVTKKRTAELGMALRR